MDIIILSIYFVLFIVISVFALYLYKRERSLGVREADLLNDAQAVLNKSNYKAQQIIESASSKAREILDKTKVFKSNIENYTNEAVHESAHKYIVELEKVSDDVVKSYGELFDDLKNKYVEDEKIAITRIETAAMMQIEDFGKKVIKQNSEYQDTLTKLVDEEKLAIQLIESKASKSVDDFSKAIDQKTSTYQTYLEGVIENEKLTIDRIDQVAKKQVDDLNSAIVQKIVDYQIYLQKFLEDEKGTVSRIEEVAIQGIVDMNKKVTEKTLSLQESLEKQVNDEFASARAEIQKYKQDEIVKIQQNVGRMVNKMAGELLGKTIKPEDQEKLLIEALEQAKSEGLFNL
jgi:F0F1-type ATP synthase membrane subunit b/b'